MKKCVIVFALLVSLSIAQSQAQGNFESGITLKKLFVDYQGLNGGRAFDFQDWSGGIELGYLGQLSEKISVAVPLKISEVMSAESLTSSRFISGEVIIRYHFNGRKLRINPYLGVGGGYVGESDGGSHTVVPGVAGLLIPVGPKTDINLEFAYRYSPDDDRSNMHFGIGFQHLLGKVQEIEVIVDEVEEEVEVTDSDGDGIADDVDLCPQVAGLAAFFGCPDTDRDGIEDSRDECPEQPGTREMNGCPDTDEDGISDKEDECPKIKGIRELNGCPEPVVQDSDGDGVKDLEDKCPQQAGPPALNGCPDSDGDGVADIDDDCVNDPGPRNTNGCPDTDGDGVSDRKDKCPNTAGSIQNQGCPEIAEEDKATLEFAVQAVEFEFGKSTLSPSSFSILNKIGDILKKYPAYNLRITGHTDSVGDEKSNLELSERRARSCYEYLSTRNIAISRMSYSGMGESQPIGSNDSAVGRSQNRRVEFDVYLR